MKKWYFVFALLVMWSSQILSQSVGLKAAYNLASINYATQVDSPYWGDKGLRSVWYAGDLDGDGKKEVVTTDYTKGGRVHVFEFATASTLEKVWSSPIRPGISNSGSTPRWVRTGDLDGDGMKEIIFPLTNTSADFEVQVWEYTGTNNDYGTTPAFTLPANYFAAQTVGNFRTNREVANVFDFDGDGLDELIMSNRDHNVYVLGVFGTFPGFASWTLEGGDPAVVPVNSKAFSISHWHSVPADLDGNGKKEIVNHMWNNWAFWSIKPTGPDTYAYPDTSRAKFYSELTKTTYGDHVSYMGIQPVDVDGDGSDEIAGILYGGNDNYYALALVDFTSADSTLYIWEPSKAAVISPRAWYYAAGLETGSFWGIGAADLNKNGKKEILLGGGNKFNVIAVEYKGTGSLLDSNSYTNTVVYKGLEPYDWGFYDVYDSAGVRKDTVQGASAESPFISKMTAPFDSDNNGNIEFAASYQSVYDSLTYKNYLWVADSNKYVLQSTTKAKNPRQFNVRILEAGVTGMLEEKQITFITPDDYQLDQNYPNPFNPTTSIRYSLPLEKQISITIYDVLGNKVRTLIDNEVRAKGSYEIVWDGTTSAGAKVASGTYICELKFGNYTKSVKMSLLK